MLIGVGFSKKLMLRVMPQIRRRGDGNPKETGRVTVNMP